MENASKALLIAGAIIIILAVLSLLVVFWDDVAIYFTASHDEKMLQQLIEFNNKFANYAGKEIRGNELVSIMNRVVDYNNFQSDMEGFEPIILNIKLEGHQNEFLYGYESVDGDESIIYEGRNITNQVWNQEGVANDRNLSRVATTSERLINKYAGTIRNLTDLKLQKMSAGIDTIVYDDDPNFLTGLSVQYKEDLEKEYSDNRDKFLSKTLGYDVNDTNIIPDKEQFIDNVKKATYQYCQYTLLKRAMFTCDKVSYNNTTGRINYMEFKVIIEDNKVKFD